MTDGTEIHFCDYRDIDAPSRRVFSFRRPKKVLFLGLSFASFAMTFLPAVSDAYASCPKKNAIKKMHLNKNSCI